jgi:hypothetical protein
MTKPKTVKSPEGETMDPIFAEIKSEVSSSICAAVSFAQRHEGKISDWMLNELSNVTADKIIKIFKSKVT